jgi:hypothetical protein
VLEQVVFPELLGLEEELLDKLSVAEDDLGDVADVGGEGLEVVVLFYHLLDVVEGVSVLLEVLGLDIEHS